LQKLLYGRDDGAEIYRFVHGITGYITSSVAQHLHVQRDIWLSSNASLGGNGSDESDLKLSDSAANTVVLLASCVVSLCSSYYLLDSIPQKGLKGWLLPHRIGYLVIPLFLGLGKIGATCLYAHRYKQAIKNDKIIGEAIASCTRIVIFVLPACVLVAWIGRIPYSPLLFTTLQAGFLSVAVLLPVNLIQTRNDDW
jgi:hypothetical protein